MHGLNLQDALAGWNLWSPSRPIVCKPEVVRPMSGGLTNHSYLLRAGDQYMVLRLNTANSEQLGLDRDMEQNTWLNAAAMDLAPALIHVDPAHKYLVSEYLIPNTLGQSNVQHVDYLRRLAELLVRVHQLPAEGVVLNISLRANHYWQSVEQLKIPFVKTLLPLRKKLEDFFSLIRIESRAESNLSLCHNDPVAENVIDTKQGLFLIDWEYAAVGDPYFDLAVYIHSEELGQEAVKFLLDAYCDGANESCHVRLKMAEANFLYMDLLWHVLQEKAYGHNLLSQKLKILMDLLEDIAS